MTKRESSALLFGDRLYFIVSQGTESVPAPTDVVFEAHLQDDPSYIGSLARKSLFAFKFDNVRFTASKWKEAYRPILLRTKFNSIKAMFNNCKCINLYLVDSKLMIVPSINQGYNKSGTRSLYDQMLVGNVDIIRI